MNSNTPTETNASTPEPQSAPCIALAEDDPSFLALLAKEDLSSIASAKEEPSSLPVATEDNLSAPAVRRKHRRNGRVAGLPKLQRDMVNHMLWNAVPYKNIVAAVDEAGYTVTERQISSWATGGYLEWSLAQEHVVQNRLDQDHLLDFLRREDAPELPEVGLQAAATRLSQVLLQKLARAEDPEAHLANYSKLVDLLLRLNREIAVTQKHRDDSRRTLGREYDAALVKEHEQISVLENERYYSNPPSESTLPKPDVPAAVPPLPTATFLADRAREERECAEAEQRKQSNKLWEACLASTRPVAKQIENSPEPEATLPPEAAR